jgi:predicted metal-binding membrane protein
MTPPLRTVLQRDRLVVGLALLAVTLLAWAWLADMARDMTRDMPRDMAAMPGGMLEGMAMARAAQWDGGALFITFVMWVVMMIGMMLPSAAPMILLYGTISRRRQAARGAHAGSAMFVLGYGLVWTGFSALATVLQAELQRAAFLSPMLDSTSDLLAGWLFLAAGAYQWTPAKRACLDKCRSPIEFLAAHWRAGPLGALRMGILHGAFCLGCCWLVMALLFAVGVMNLAWVAAIAVFVLMEKILPGGEWIARAGGVGMAGAGLALLAA